MLEIQSLVRKINSIIIEAGKTALDYYLKPITTYVKKDQSIVSEADREVEKLIQKRLKGLIKDAEFIGEEESEYLDADEKIKKAKQAFESEYIWAIDPIDGTKNFVSQYGDWSVSIGLLRKGKEGHIPFLGSIYIPLKDKLYYTDGDNSYVVFNASKENFLLRKIEPIEFKVDDLKNKIFTINEGRRKRYNLNNINTIRIPGGAVLELASTAAGESMGTIIFAHIWDNAAGLAICRAAGVNIYMIDSGIEVKEFKVDDFIFSDENKDWMLKQDYLVANESAKEILLENIVKVDKKEN